MIRQYETTFIVDSHLPQEQIDQTIEKFIKTLQDGGALIKLVDRWGKRRMAYEISKKQYGFYVYVRFEGPGEIVAALEHDYKLDESILRYLTIQLTKKMVEKEELKPLAIAEPTAGVDAKPENKRESDDEALS
jgi:small subunit ribosomal protein S6